MGNYPRYIQANLSLFLLGDDNFSTIHSRVHTLLFQYSCCDSKWLLQLDRINWLTLSRMGIDRTLAIEKGKDWQVCCSLFFLEIIEREGEKNFLSRQMFAVLSLSLSLLGSDSLLFSDTEPIILTFYMDRTESSWLTETQIDGEGCGGAEGHGEKYSWSEAGLQRTIVLSYFCI